MCSENFVLVGKGFNQKIVFLQGLTKKKSHIWLDIYSVSPCKKPFSELILYHSLLEQKFENKLLIRRLPNFWQSTLYSQPLQLLSLAPKYLVNSQLILLLFKEQKQVQLTILNSRRSHPISSTSFQVNTYKSEFSQKRQDFRATFFSKFPNKTRKGPKM